MLAAEGVLKTLVALITEIRVVKCGSKSKHKKDTCFKGIVLCAYYVLKLFLSLNYLHVGHSEMALKAPLLIDTNFSVFNSTPRYQMANLTMWMLKECR